MHYLHNRGHRRHCQTSHFCHCSQRLTFHRLLLLSYSLASVYPSSLSPSSHTTAMHLLFFTIATEILSFSLPLLRSCLFHSSFHPVILYTTPTSNFILINSTSHSPLPLAFCLLRVIISIPTYRFPPSYFVLPSSTPPFFPLLLLSHSS